MVFELLSCRYPSRRNVVFSRLGMVSTGQVLAAQAGLEILKKGGNAADAAVTTAACLMVTEPTFHRQARLRSRSILRACSNGRTPVRRKDHQKESSHRTRGKGLALWPYW
ncbi:MAG: gamma-glutamyltransferase [Synergistales bacterium]|nr:gamma-glutamyltransferase [Synergistales bacterium]